MEIFKENLEQRRIFHGLWQMVTRGKRICSKINQRLAFLPDANTSRVARNLIKSVCAKMKRPTRNWLFSMCEGTQRKQTRIHIASAQETASDFRGSKEVKQSQFFRGEKLLRYSSGVSLPEGKLRTLQECLLERLMDWVHLGSQSRTHLRGPAMSLQAHCISGNP